MDAVDAVLVDLSNNAQPELLKTHSQAFPDDLRESLLALTQPGLDELQRLALADTRMSHLFVETTQALLHKAAVKASQISAIGSHGQTVRHQPSGPEPFSLQIGNPSLIAEHTGITTVADFRRRDMAAGGQGAPLVPAFHNTVFRSPEANRVIVNIGGMANITVLPSNPEGIVHGFDTGPGNVLMDTWVYQHLQKRMDENGQWAGQGKVHKALLTALMTDPYFALSPPKSTGRERFNRGWLETLLMNFSQSPSALMPEDIQATLCELTAASIAEAIIKHAPHTRQTLICGGGAHNRTLLQRLCSRLQGIQVETTAVHGIEPDWVEAMAFAWLAQQTLAGKPGNLPSVTGARRAVILGGIYKA